MGCSLTCRKRRIKCDEKLPRCGQCTKSDRECLRSSSLENTTPSADSIASRPKTSVEIDRLPEPVGEPGEARASSTTSPSTVHCIKSPQAVITIQSPPVVTFSKSPQAVLNTQSPSAVTHTGLFDVPVGAEPVLPPDASAPSIAPLLSPGEASAWPNNTTAFEWFDLLAQDALTNIQRHNDVASDAYRWDFDKASLSRRQSHDGLAMGNDLYYGIVTGPSETTNETAPSWNTPTPIPIEGDDLFYMRHYVEYIGPLLDLFDPARHFTNLVPHLATRNVGLLKSILAVSARHISLDIENPPESEGHSILSSSDPNESDPKSFPLSKPARVAKQYYYETLRYLSQTLSYQSYADSHEILATAIMISTYEMFESTGPANNSDWDRHLRGGFWIQRCQDNDGESTDGLRQAVWWAWLRQDMWAALRAGRPTMTIWCPRRSLQQLTPDEYATRIVYIAAKVVQYAGVDPESPLIDIQQRIEQGHKLREALRAWDSLLPRSFRPIVSHKPFNGYQNSAASSVANMATNTSAKDSSSEPAQASQAITFPPIWIHPPSHAGAVQMYNLALIILLLHMPNAGGLEVYRARQRQLDQSVNTICGIASQETTDMPLAFVNIQALYTGGYQSLLY